MCFSLCGGTLHLVSSLRPLSSLGVTEATPGDAGTPSQGCRTSAFHTLRRVSICSQVTERDTRQNGQVGRFRNHRQREGGEPLVAECTGGPCSPLPWTVLPELKADHIATAPRPERSQLGQGLNAGKENDERDGAVDSGARQGAALWDQIVRPAVRTPSRQLRGSFCLGGWRGFRGCCRTCFSISPTRMRRLERRRRVWKFHMKLVLFGWSHLGCSEDNYAQE